MPEQPQDRPDVEAIVAEIRRDIRDAEFPDPEQAQADADAEPSIYHNLKVVNDSWEVGKHRRGHTGWLRCKLDSICGVPIDQIQTFNSHVTRVLNRLVRLLDGTASPEKPAAPAHDSDRLGQLDKRLDRLEERIRRLEGGS